MIELITTVGITAGSAVLFGYWFRYTCLLILSAKTTRDYAGEVAAANHLNFLEVQHQLLAHSQSGAPVELDRLHAALEHDYTTVKYLLDHMTGETEEESPVEARMLEMNYKLMCLWYRLNRSFSMSASCRALQEMSQVISHFASIMGERAALASAAAA